MCDGEGKYADNNGDMVECPACDGYGTIEIE